MKTLSAEITELHVQIKRAGEDREAENKDFQTTIVDQQETQKLLQKALQILKAVYKPTVAAGGAAALAQQAPGGGEDQPAPPPGFREYGQNRAGGGVVAMIEQIISDAHHMEEMATKDEQTAQQQYETFVKDTNTAVQDKQQSLVNKGEVHAKAKGKLIEVEGAIREHRVHDGQRVEILPLMSNTLAGAEDPSELQPVMGGCLETRSPTGHLPSAQRREPSLAIATILAGASPRGPFDWLALKAGGAPASEVEASAGRVALGAGAPIATARDDVAVNSGVEFDGRAARGVASG
ncbi:unnamed protein product [Prorocentrum cordatum]|uniref:Uncharacterized protein n=1 Tax=Prorocentrum cordatum TaxID=2364126 RepID=A0ABN9RLX7_9DINO|nr:unnamed protein product [Polarella glacialis]